MGPARMPFNRRPILNPHRHAVWFVLVAGLATAQGQETGLAASYPTDAGTGRDKAVLFHDDFEDGDVGARWDEVNRRKGRGATDDANPVAAEADKAIARGTRSA